MGPITNCQAEDISAKFKIPLRAINPADVEFFKSLSENCLIGELESSSLICAKCGSPVIIDWFERKAECQGCDDI